MKTKFLLFYLCFLFSFILGCKKEVITETVTIEVPVETAWKENKNFRQYTKTKTNSLATAEFLLLDGPNDFSRLHSDGTLEARWKSHHPEFYELPIHKNFYVEIKDNLSTILLSNALGELTNYDEFIHFPSIEPNFEEIDLGRWTRTNIAINDNGQCLVPIKSTTVVDSTILYLLSTEVRSFTSGIDIVKIIDTIRTVIPVNGLTNVVGFEDYFLLATSGQGVYKIYADGTYRKILIDFPILRFIKHQGEIHAVKQSNDFFVSSDEGENWNGGTGFPTPLYTHQSFGDSLIAFRGDNMYTLTLGEGFYRLRPLNNEGLESTRITSLASFNDTVYVTTLSGVYQRSLDDFYEDL